MSFLEGYDCVTVKDYKDKDHSIRLSIKLIFITRLKLFLWQEKCQLENYQVIVHLSTDTELQSYTKSYKYVK
jgi:hypothetical protein